MKIFSAVLLGLLFFAVLAATQEPKSSNQSIPAYTVAQEQTLSGIIQEMKDLQCPVSGTIGTHIYVKTGRDTVAVRLAPAKFLTQYSIVLKPGDEVSVMASRQ